MVVAVAGNCRTSSIDDLSSIAELCRKHGVWFHVDACHGGSLLFSRSLREDLVGIEQSDSVSLDPHKGLFVGYPLSYLLVRDGATLARFCRYPDKVEDPTVFDLGLITPFFGSRPFTSLKLWLLIKHLGLDGLESVVESRKRVYLKCVALMEETGKFLLLNDADFYRSAFVYYPQQLREFFHKYSVEPSKRAQLISRYTAEFAEISYRKGKAVFDLFSLQDLSNRLGNGTEVKYQVMGMSIGHPHIDQKAFDDVREVINSVAHDVDRLIESEMKQNFPEAQFRVEGGPAGWEAWGRRISP
jgi:glutamate/tyrosine decarboxylase-like PLP-dependent enzyme